MSAKLKVLTVLTTILLGVAANAAEPKTGTKDKKIVFLNASKNREGMTAKLAKSTLEGLNYKTVNLVDYKIDQVGQESESDEYKKLIADLSHADVLIIGTPVYWSSMSGYLKTFVDRLESIVDGPLATSEAPLNGAEVYLVVQGSRPVDEALPGIETVVRHISRRFFMTYEGVIRNSAEAGKVNLKLIARKSVIAPKQNRDR